ncbi:pilus assembly protein [Candidatus Nitrosoglobus terrae]|uniref:Pilus assembly protein n=1 Tax=Candidatus Nitrosoglobus terrae TaxID=1630141 RepID=A0A1Q2SM40_9GAMM|nr:type IV pilin protein [Candidatus Nitrosoglobus terrae]BAW80190.1 pilus assembly protein [Candidatus Nitrosoglobus terrae]
MNRKAGFTLIEMMITMAIIAILAAIALPTYQGTVRKSRRSEATMALLGIQLQEEKWRANQPQYGSLQAVGGTTSNDYYNFSAVNISATTYTLQATAKAGTDQINDTAGSITCSSLNLDQNGAKTPTACW